MRGMCKDCANSRPGPAAYPHLVECVVQLPPFLRDLVPDRTTVRGDATCVLWTPKPEDEEAVSDELDKP